MDKQNLHEVLQRRARDLRDETALAASGECVTHVPTGFNDIDSVFGGVRLGVCTLVLGHTGDGKSAFAKQLVEGAARANCRSLLFSGEDGECPTAERYLSDGTGIPTNEIGRLDLSPAELDRLEQCARDASWSRYVEVVFGQITVDEVLERLRDEQHTDGPLGPLRLAVIDYAQIFGDAHNLEGEIARLASGLNALSNRPGRQIATVLLSQVRTGVLARGREQFLRDRSINGFVPRLGDTEWCTRAEKSTKAVWSVIRDGRWKREMGLDVPDDCATLHVVKANFGPMGHVPLTWRGDITRFGSVS